MPQRQYSAVSILVGLVALSTVAFFWPSPWANPFLASKPLLDWLILITMFAIGTMLPLDEVGQVLRRWPTVFGGVAIQYAAMPALAYLAGRLWGLDGPLLMGVALVGCVPGAMASNVLTLNAGGNTSYSVSLTTTATVVSPLMVPLMLWLIVGRAITSPELFLNIGIQLTWTVVLPVVVGHVLRRRLGLVERHASRVGPIVANLAILWIIAYVVAKSRDDLRAATWVLGLPLLCINLGGYLAGYLGGRMMGLPEPMRRALTLEVGMQNAGLGAVLAAKTLANEAAAVPPAIYTFGCMLTGTILACVWSSLGGDSRQDSRDP